MIVKEAAAVISAASGKALSGLELKETAQVTRSDLVLMIMSALNE
ncbi:hypothetical protein HMSSN036_02050 [Paenibacillus macerans]|nr:hypothetical protein HMSSN036_02050 [Paenibacillus macerans]